MRSTWGWIGGIGSILYVLVMAVIAVFRWDELWQLDLNELGDFLAGAFGPLAILWLVLGYFQQGEELRQNTEALHLQAEELRQSVKQQEQMVKVAREQLEEERRRVAAALEPSLRFTAKTEDSAYGGTDWLLEIHNFGGVCTQLSLSSSSATWYTQEKTTERLGPEKPWVVSFHPIDGRNEAEEEFAVELFGVTAGNRAFKATGLCEFHWVGDSFELRALTFKPEIDIGE